MENRRYMVKTTRDRLEVFECCLDVMGDDRDKVIEDWMKDYVLTALQDDVTTIWMFRPQFPYQPNCRW